MQSAFDHAARWSTRVYNKESLSSLPWYNEKLDQNLALELDTRSIHSGKFLDIGAGHGTQSNQLQLRGFDVVGTDINAGVLDYARQLNPHVNFQLDNFVVTTLSERFEYVFDRGCFHWMQRHLRPQYIKNLHKIVKCLFFLKVIDKSDVTRLPGADYDEVLNLFEKLFNIHSVKHDFFNNNSTTMPSMFFVMSPK
jgi:2-polyprenyl-3-methyl-5-hydroxy-6-metoxy-1,4-benzoquinol methylase